MCFPVVTLQKSSSSVVLHHWNEDKGELKVEEMWAEEEWEVEQELKVGAEAAA